MRNHESNKINKYFGKYIICVNLLIFLLTIACTPINSINSNKKFEEQYIQADNVNSTIKISIQEWVNNSYKIGDHISLVVENHSQNIITFPSDYGIKIFTYENSQWIEIENCLEYTPNSERMIFPKGSNHPGFHVVSINPDLADYNHPVNIRIIVLGAILDYAQNSHKVAAYEDVRLNP